MMSGRFLANEPCRVVRCLIKNEVETDKQLKRIFARLNRFLLENEFKISFSNKSVRKFSKKVHENDQWKNFLKRTSPVTFRTATQHATLTLRIERSCRTGVRVGVACVSCVSMPSYAELHMTVSWPITVAYRSWSYNNSNWHMSQVVCHMSHVTYNVTDKVRGIKWHLANSASTVLTSQSIVCSTTTIERWHQTIISLHTPHATDQ